MSKKFNAGVEESYADLPVPVNYLYWKRGNGQLANLKDTDPGAYFGGFSASVRGKEEDYPQLPIPVVTRTSQDGQNTFERYASNVIHFLPLTSRMRYEKREKASDHKGGEVEKVVAVTKQYISGVHIGFQPHKQVFGLLYSDDLSVYAPAVIKLNKWSSFLSFSKAEGAWIKVDNDDNMALVRRYGSVGMEKEVKGKGTIVVPMFETFNEGQSTPIEAIGLNDPLFIEITDEMNTLHQEAQAWAKCPRWNASGKVVDPVESQELPPMPETSEEFPFG